MSFTDIFSAVKEGTVEDVRSFVEQNGVASIHAKDNDNWTPLWLATKHNSNVEVLKYLVSQGADINEKSKSGRTSLHFAAQDNSNVEVLKYLVSQGAKVNEKNNDGFTPLHDAAGFNPNVEVLKYLVSQGADVNAKSNMDWTPLHRATISNPNVEVLEYLASQSENVNAKSNIAEGGLAPLHIAAAKGNIKFVECLIRHGADVNVKNKSGSGLGKVSPLLAAAREGHREIAKILKEAGADVNAVIDETGQTMLHLGVTGVANPVEAAKILVSVGANIEARDKKGYTPLQTLLSVDEIELAKYLVDEEGADIEAKDNDGNTPLTQYVFYKGRDINIIKFLVESGADIKAENNTGETALSRAFFLEDAEVIEYFSSKIDEEDYIKQDEKDLKKFLGLKTVSFAKEMQQKIECSNAKIDVGDYKKRGLNFLHEGLNDQAIAEFTQAIQLISDDADSYIKLGMAHWQKAEARRLEGIDCSQIKEYDQAINDFSNAIRLAPGEADAYHFRGTSYAQKSEYGKAITDFNEAIRLKSDYCHYYLSRGIAYKESQQYDLAKRDFEKVLALNPDEVIIFATKEMLNKLPREEPYKPEVQKYEMKNDHTGAYKWCIFNICFGIIGILAAAMAGPNSGFGKFDKMDWILGILLIVLYFIVLKMNSAAIIGIMVISVIDIIKQISGSNDAMALVLSVVWVFLNWFMFFNLKCKDKTAFQLAKDNEAQNPENSFFQNIFENADDTKKCPYCAEKIKKEAAVCRFCNRDLGKQQGGSL